MITITRRLASRLRAVLRRAFAIPNIHPLEFLNSPSGLTIRARSIDAAIEYRSEGGPEERLRIPATFLDDCEGKKDDPVQLEVVKDGRVAVQWRDGPVPQLVEHDAAQPADADKFPRLPETLAQNPAAILDAMHEAYGTGDPLSTRYALGCAHLRGKLGQIAATDSHQLLVQGGFHFPWDEDLLVPLTKVFVSPEFPRGQPVEIGKTEDHVAFRIGEWTIWLAINKDGRFPDVVNHLPDAAAAVASCRIAASDAEFLAATLPKLPSNDSSNDPVTVDLNGRVAVRARATDMAAPTEVLLTNSTRTGEPIRIQMNRRYLARALKLGFRDVHLSSHDAAVLCEDAHRQYVWMPLEGDTAIRPSDDATRIESPAAGDRAEPTKRQRRTTKMSANTNSTPASRNGMKRPAETKVEEPIAAEATAEEQVASPEAQEPPAGPIQQAIALRDALRDAANKANDLVRSLQQEKKQTRQLRSALASLRALQSLEV